jgi:hypothetical protein
MTTDDDSTTTNQGSGPGSEGPSGQPTEPAPDVKAEPTPDRPDPLEPQTSALKPEQETRS